RKQTLEGDKVLSTHTATNVHPQVPEGGWGWVIAVAFFFVEAFTSGVIKSFGVFFKDLRESFTESISSISWIVSICVFVRTFTAPLSAALSSRFGPRRVVMVGGVLISAGTATATYARTVLDMYITVGVVSGLGYSLSSLPTVITLSQYFHRRRLLVTAVASTGECFAVFLLAPAITALKEYIGWRHSLLSVGVLQLSVVICGLVLRPVLIRQQGAVGEEPPEEPTETTAMLEPEQTGASAEPTDWGAETATSPSPVPGDPQAEPKSGEQHVAVLVEDVSAATEPTPQLLDLSMLNHGSFICYVLFGLFAALGFFIPSLYIIALSLSLGISKERSAYVLSAAGVAEICGRITAGWALSKQPIRRIYMQLVCTVLLTVALSVFPLASGFCGLVVCSLFVGFTLGTVVGTHIALLAEDDVAGAGKMPSAVGIYVFVQSFSGLAGPSLAGVVVDMTKDYSSAFYCSAAGMALAAVFLSLVRPCKAGLCHGQ
ncbi:MOT7 protein, partial [Urocolius indicus]|nr:MOT7 protein [Urocolius indicus]